MAGSIASLFLSPRILTVALSFGDCVNYSFEPVSRILNKRGADGMDNFKLIKSMIIDFL